MELTILALLYTGYLTLPAIIGFLTQPPWAVYLGTVHHPQDYFYYLSQFTQGTSRFLTSINLYSSEPIAPSLIGWTSVLAGRILSLFGIAPVYQYQIMTVVYTLLFFLATAALLRLVFPEKRERTARIISMIFLFFANTFRGAPTFFANVTEPPVRFTRVPHQMLGLVCILIPILYNNNYLLIGFSSFVLASINPIQWALVLTTLGITRQWKQTGIYFIVGFPMVFYLKTLFASPPYSQLAAWEQLQQIPITLWSFIQSFGPVTLIAVINAPIFLRRFITAKLAILTYTVISIGLFVLPISRYLGVTNIRFLSAVTILGVSCIAADLIQNIPIRNRALKLAVITVVVLLFIVYHSPLFITQINTLANRDTSNAYIHLNRLAIDAFMETKTMTTDQDIILVTWPFDASFPALTGRHGYMGHPLITINAEKKVQDAYYFFDAKVDDEQMRQFLTANRITYVLSFTDVTKFVRPFLSPVYRNDLLTLYKVL